MKYIATKSIIVLGSLAVLFYFIIATAQVPDPGFSFLWKHPPGTDHSTSSRSDYRFPQSVLLATESEPSTAAGTLLQKGDYILAVGSVALHETADWQVVFPRARTLMITWSGEIIASCRP